MAYLPAGYSDDSENEFDDYDGFDDNEVYVSQDQANVESNIDVGNGWNDPRSLSPTTDQDYFAASRDAFTFLKLIQSNDVFGVGECLKIIGSLVDHNFGSSSAFISAGGERPIFVACIQAFPEMLSL